MSHETKRPSSRRVRLPLTAVAILTASAALAQPAIPIRIGYQSNTDWLLLVARDLKLFEKAGLEPTFEKFVAGPPMKAAARDKRIDVTTIGSVPFLIGLSEGLDWVILGINPEGAYGEGLVTSKGSGIEAVGDLRGKRIAFVEGTNAHFGLVMALQQLGIRRDQVKLVGMAPGEQVAALAGNDIDAAWVWEPWMQKMAHEANGRVLVTEGEMGIYMGVSVYAARREWIRDNRGAAIRFLRALIMANDAIQKDPGIATKSLAAEMGIHEEWAEAIYENSPPPKILLWTDPRYRYSLVKGSGFHRRFGYLQSFLLEEKLISHSVDLRDILDASLIADALKTPGGPR